MKNLTVFFIILPFLFLGCETTPFIPDVPNIPDLPDLSSKPLLNLKPLPNPTPDPPDPPDPPPDPPPPPKIEVEVCLISELLPYEFCLERIIKEYVQGTEPIEICNICKALDPPDPSPPDDPPDPPPPDPLTAIIIGEFISCYKAISEEGVKFHILIEITEIEGVDCKVFKVTYDFYYPQFVLNYSHVKIHDFFILGYNSVLIPQGSTTGIDSRCGKVVITVEAIDVNNHLLKITMDNVINYPPKF